MNSSELIHLDGRIALVTGAGQGLGRAICLALAKCGAGGIAVNDFVMERAETVAAEVRELGVKACAVQADVSDKDSIAAAINEAKNELGTISILVNNAGNAGPSGEMRHAPLFWDTDPSDWPRYFDTNLYGVMYCCHQLLPDMVENNWGRILTIVSDSARVGEARLAAYSAAKAGAAGFMRSLAKEAGRFGICCNSISLSTLEPNIPEPTRSEFLESDTAKTIASRYAIRRLGKPEDVTGLAALLCSDAAQWITGQTYPVNGGYDFAQ